MQWRLVPVYLCEHRGEPSEAVLKWQVAGLPDVDFRQQHGKQNLESLQGFPSTCPFFLSDSAHLLSGVRVNRYCGHLVVAVTVMTIGTPSVTTHFTYSFFKFHNATCFGNRYQCNNTQRQLSAYGHESRRLLRAVNYVLTKRNISRDNQSKHLQLTLQKHTVECIKIKN